MQKIISLQVIKRAMTEDQLIIIQLIKIDPNMKRFVVEHACSHKGPFLRDKKGIFKWTLYKKKLNASIDCIKNV